MTILILSILLAFAFGFAAHRAGVCTVAAVGEVITTGTARTFLSFAKVVGWVLLINCLAGFFAPERLQPYLPPMLTSTVIIGGFLFGVGAAINGGCSFSTISKLAQGELHLAATLPAFIAGAVLANRVDLSLPVLSTNPYFLDFATIPPLFLILLSLWAIIELSRISTEAVRAGVINSISRKRYRLSSAAAFMGMTSGLLYLFNGRWAYSSKILDYYARDTDTAFVGTSAFYLLIALLVGAFVSAFSNRQFRFNFARSMWQRNLAGGFIMGFGAMLVPGGNGKLILQDLPHLSVHALVAYAAMIAGIAVTLMVQMHVFGKMEIVTCNGDECVIKKTQ
jgi:uncharacterized membrane protein YedE/YeeE